MNTKTWSLRPLRPLLPLLAAGLALLFGIGCSTLPERLYSITQAPDGKFYTPTGEQRLPSHATVKVENTLDKTTLAIFAREDKIITIVPPHEIRTVHVELDYYQQDYHLILFAKPSEDMAGKELAKGSFRFSNYRYYDAVYGQNFGAVRPETKVWVIRRNDFTPQKSYRSSSVGNNSTIGLGWFR